MTQPVAWVLSNGLIGMDNQSIGLAEALGVDYTVKRIVPAAPWKHLPPALWWKPLQNFSADSDSLCPPWPDVVIGTGRMSVAASIAIRRASGGKTKNIRIQHPRVGFRHFDIIVASHHDHCQGENVIEALGAVNRMSARRMADEAQHFLPRLQHLPRPWVTVLLGGNNSQYQLDAAFAKRLAAHLSRALRETGGSALITPSRRTDAAFISVLQDDLQGLPTEFWSGEGENPYFAWMGLADRIVVTADSVNMASEASFTGKPVFVAGLTGKNNKFERFHRGLQEYGSTRPFTGELPLWQYTPLDETRRVAELIKQKWGW